MWQLQFVSGNLANIKPLTALTIWEALDAFNAELVVARKTNCLLQLVNDRNKPVCEQDFRKEVTLEYVKQDFSLDFLIENLIV